MLAYKIAKRINATGARELTHDEERTVVEARFNRRGRYYFMMDNTLLDITPEGEASAYGNGKDALLFPLTTVEELDDHLVFVRNRAKDRKVVIDAYLDFRFARTNRQYSQSLTKGVYGRSGLPRGKAA